VRSVAVVARRSAWPKDRAFAATVALVLVGIAALVFWNAFHYDWVRGYDAFSIARYMDVVEHRHRLPTRAETDVWHNPPLFFVVGAIAQQLATWGGWRTDPYKAVQLLSALCGVALCLLAFLTARELWPRRRAAQLGALALAAATPVLIRAAALYHPEPLAAALVAAALYVLVRSFARSRYGLRAGVLAGLLLGFANLTRTWALAALAAAFVSLAPAWWWRRDREVLRFAIAVMAVASLLLLPWLAYKAVRYGNPLAFSTPNAAQWQGGPRPLAFYTALNLPQVFSHPYSDHYRNHLLPVVYSDWWGDYWRYWRVPPSMINSPPTLTGSLDSERRLQSYVGILPSLGVLVGFFALAGAAVRQRSPALVVLTSSVVFLALSYTGFLIEYPKQDGDNMKSLYLLDAAVPLAVCGGWVLEKLRRAPRLVLAGIALVAFELLYLDVHFLVLT
jgi:4-amino-4-deoxy-L-arabinose transferase-like glycosyltransferase